jgi:hypothetical protein
VHFNADPMVRRGSGRSAGASGRSAQWPSQAPTEAVAILRARIAEFAYGTLTDGLSLLAARISW